MAETDHQAIGSLARRLGRAYHRCRRCTDQRLAREPRQRGADGGAQHAAPIIPLVRGSAAAAGAVCSSSSSGRADRQRWTELARLVAREGFEPESYIGVLVVFAPDPLARPPRPRELKRPPCLGSYRDRRAEAVEGRRIRLEGQLELLGLAYEERRLTVEEPASALSDVLGRRDPRLTPLLRYAIARRAGDGTESGALAPAARRWAAAAVGQYLLAPAVFDEAWGALLPDNFRAEAFRQADIEGA